MMKTRKGHNVYPITVAQKFHLYYAKYCPNMAVLNIGTSLTIGTELDWNVLRDSINYAYARVMKNVLSTLSFFLAPRFCAMKLVHAV